MSEDPDDNTPGKTPTGPTTTDLLGLSFISDPRLAPDGRTVAAVVTTIVASPPESRSSAAQNDAATPESEADRADQNDHSQRSHEGADVEPPRYRSRIHLFRVPDEAAVPEAYDGAPVGGAAIAAVAWPPVSGDGGLEFTQTEFRDSSPRFSNDGAWLAFQRVSAKKQPPQLYVMSLTGGEPVGLTDHETGVGEFAWHPDGKSLVYVSRGEEQEADEDGLGRRLTRMRYRGDGQGYLPAHAADLYRVDLSGAVQRQTNTPDELAFGAPGCLAFSPDGATLYYTRAHDEATHNDFRADVVALDVSTLEKRILAESVLGAAGLRPAPSGDYLAVVAASRQDDLASSQGAWLLDLRPGRDGDGLQLLSGELELGPAEAGDSRHGQMPNLPIWSGSKAGHTGHKQAGTASMASNGSERLVVNIHGRGRTGLAELGLDGAVDKSGFDDTSRRAVTAFDALSCDGGTATAFIAETPLHPGELWFRSARGAEFRLSGLNDTWRSELDLQLPAGPFAVSSEGAGNDMEGAADSPATPEVEYWILSPTRARSDGAVVVEVHGGPHTAYGNGFMLEFQLLAARGYHVVYGNPRGSSSYGHHFATCMLGGYGSIDADDVLNITAAAVARIGRESAPVHLTGGSYGGFMTNWLIGVTNRFKSAVSQRSISNWTSMYGTSDIGPSFVERELCGVPWRDHEVLWRQSPLRNADAIDTPLLLIHSEQDYRCPIEQAEQLFSALKRIGKCEVELLRFPGEGHELSRSGRPDRRMQRLDALIDWFERHA